MKTVSQLDAQGYFVNLVEADESPLEPGVFLIPGGAIDAPAPVVPAGSRARWSGAWFIEDIPAPNPAPEPVSTFVPIPAPEPEPVEPPPPPPPAPPPAPTTDQLAAQIDAQADAIIAAVIGNRGQEYVDAEAGAAAFKATGYTGQVPGAVQVWATVEGQSATWAADDILAQAVAWRAASLAIRQARLTAKKGVREGDAAAALAAWAGFVSTIKTQLGVA